MSKLSDVMKQEKDLIAQLEELRKTKNLALIEDKLPDLQELFIGSSKFVEVLSTMKKGEIKIFLEQLADDDTIEYVSKKSEAKLKDYRTKLDNRLARMNDGKRKVTKKVNKTSDAHTKDTDMKATEVSPETNIEGMKNVTAEWNEQINRRHQATNEHTTQPDNEQVNERQIGRPRSQLQANMLGVLNS